MPADNKIEHLKLVQATITRMAANSFLLKGWTVTLVAALFAFGAKEADRVFVVIAWVPVLVFAALDSFYLWQEKLFRALYDDVAQRPADGDPWNFTMDPRPFKATKRWRNALKSGTIWGYYGPVALLLLALTCYFALRPKEDAIPTAGPKTITISIQ
jgi:hypothetical protein